MSSGTIAVCATQHRTWNLAIGPLRAVLIEDIKQQEFSTRTRSRFSGHLECSLFKSGVLLKKRQLPRRSQCFGGSEIGGKKIPSNYLSIDCPAKYQPAALGEPDGI
jgi:hypothetical protein